MKRLLFILIGLLVLIAGGLAALISLHPARFAVLDFTPPEIALEAETPGLRSPSTTLRLRLTDDWAGVGSFKATVTQGDTESAVDGQVFPTPSKEEEISLKIKRGEPYLKEGKPATIRIIATDSSLVANSTTLEKELKVDYSPPSVEVLSGQHNGKVGGALLVIFRAIGEDVTDTGVMVNDLEVPGYPAELLDESLADPKDLYFSLFPLPLGMEPDEFEIYAFARDDVGNEARNSFYYTLKPRPFRHSSLKLSRRFFEGSIRKLLGSYLSAAGLPFRDYEEKDAEAEQLIADFKLINEDYRKLLEAKLAELTAQSSAERFFEGAFIKPLAAAPTSSFAEARSYSLGEAEAGGSYHLGIDLAHLVNAEVHASNSAKVLYVGDFGIYGNTVILDHGFGLISLYGHLSSTAVVVGEQVAKGQKIGRTGSTGLAGGDHLHFELRLHNQAITPFEWLDPKWVRDHIALPVKNVSEIFAEPQDAG